MLDIAPDPLPLEGKLGRPPDEGRQAYQKGADRKEFERIGDAGEQRRSGSDRHRRRRRQFEGEADRDDERGCQCYEDEDSIPFPHCDTCQFK